jgi:hypothetical protein
VSCTTPTMWLPDLKGDPDMTYSAGTQARQHRPDALIVGAPKAKLDVTRTALQLAADRSRWEGLIRFDAISRCRVSLDVDGEWRAQNWWRSRRRQFFRQAIDLGITLTGEWWDRRSSCTKVPAELRQRRGGVHARRSSRETATRAAMAGSSSPLPVCSDADAPCSPIRSPRTMAADGIAGSR